MRYRLPAFLLAGVFALMIITSSAPQPVSGQPAHNVAAPGAQTPSIQVNLQNRALKKTHIQYDTVPSAVPAGWSAILPAMTVNCPGAGTCTYDFEAVVQIIGATDAKWAIGASVDAGLIDGSGFYMGVTNASYYLQGATRLTKSGILTGAHTVQLHVVTDSGGYVAYRSHAVRVFKP